MYLRELLLETPQAIVLRNLPKYFKGNDPLAELVPERKGVVYGLHPDKWQSTFYSLTNKDLDKIKHYRPQYQIVPPGTLVGDMAIANRFYRTEDPKLAAKLAQEYQQSLRPYDQADISQYRMPELLMPAGSIAEKWSNKYKRSIDCNNPKGFSQRAHCQGREKTESLDQDVVENFADGKKTGRKGLAKRMGVDCSQPVGKLRKIAANSSGERQRMAHWCANMKAGKNESVNEGADDNIDTIIQSFVASPTGQKYKQHDCKTVTRAFVRWAEQNKIPTQVVVLAPPSADFIAKNPRYKGKSGEGDGHIMPIVNGNAIDFTVRQFGVSRPFENPLVTPVVSLPSVYGKFGYFTHKPEWFLRGKSYWIGALNSIPNEIFNQNFGEEMLEYIIA